ncbi:serine/threonine protein kinase [Acanthamoeba castellanii str. Neff]|uniref:non-specific serine/threonine protein kinase n=1 Tax=Acanthamoeba castellanii (strain ATCC 30010 / Neff) TaxID=1257118 RepID=L8HBY6_ACACF|nr:serine/threonine protein kinase [Acanthamoeba castellanii str. Neff]ELR22700.1 serine/threonine protein kinase [Acanthamoeba castellanii str. Neff]
MALSNPAFNATVGVNNNINFPMKTANTTILLTDIQITQTVSANPYSFTPWVNNVVSSERSLAVAKLRNVAGYDVAISQESITAALNDLIDKGENDLINAPSANSWPALSINSIIIRQTSMTDCTRATSLLDWIYWTQNSTEALNQIVISGMGVVVNSDLIKRQMYKFLAGVTCQGVHVSSLYGCVTADGLLCSDHGSCVNSACRCFDGYTGLLCESTVSDSSTDTTAIAIGVAVPVAVLVFLLLLAIIIALLMMLVFKRKKRDDWEIEYDELEIGSMLGSGGYGEVYKAMWKGTEVAVKMMPTDSVSKEMAKNFQDEVRVMTALRHPNVVLFMAACTRPPKMAIVMEFMALGSLFDLLHNELVPDVPHVLKVKMVYQAAKGMHFLHSSGIVHRDLKSLNLLLDAKWNVKVSDFGLTKFKAELNANEANDVATIQWAAPEVLNETQSVDYILADVYSFGVVGAPAVVGA